MATNDDATTTNGIRRDIEVHNPPEEVWEVLVDDDERGAWFGGRTRLDPSPGGRGWFEDTDGNRRSANVDEAEPGRRLAWTWWPDPASDGEPDTDHPGGASRVQIDLTPLPGGTRISVTETPLTPMARASALTGARGPLVDLELRLLLTSRQSAVVFART